MTTVQAIQNPASGEDVVAVQPVMAPSADAGWHRRLNVFTGRALTAPALTGDQAGRIGRLAAAGQTLSPGVVTGLGVRVAAETPTGASNGATQAFVHVSAGVGLAASGETVVVPKLIRLALDSIPVYGPTTLFQPPTAATAGTDRQIGPTLGALRAQAAATPPTATLPPVVAVLVVQPVVGQFIGDFNPNDPCEQDVSANAFENWLLKDGSRLLLYTWPSEWLTLPPDTAGTWHNVLANAIFETERQHGPGPWEGVGVPIALIALTAGLVSTRFVDRFSVVRAGGKAQSRTPILSGSGTPALWRARLQQFASQIAAPDVVPQTIGDLGKQFRFLPPAGLLPRQALESGAKPGTWVTRFFPSTYRIQAMPVPVEQLDYVLEASAHLAPFDATVPNDDVRLLVPVSQPWFEPGLLQTETINPIFQQTLTSATTARGVTLLRRQTVRAWASTVMQAITGTGITFPSPDADALDANEALAAPPLNPAETPPVVTNAATNTQLSVTNPLDDLKNFLKSTPLSAAELADLDAHGLDRFLVTLQAKVDATNDTLDLAFVRVQTDVYRHRQLMLDNVSASRLATSPALAAIAQGDTAAATRDQLNEFVAAARSTQIGRLPAVAAEGIAAPAAAAAAAPSATVASAPAVSRVVSEHALFLSGEIGSTVARATQPQATAINIDGGSAVIGHGLALKTFPNGGGDGEPPVRITREPKDTSAISKPIETGVVSSGPTATQIEQQSPIVGNNLLFQRIDSATKQLRTVTVAERLQQPAAPEAKTYTVASKVDTFRNLSTVPINVDDLAVPGFRDATAGEVTRTLGTIRSDNNASLGQILAGAHDPDPQLSTGQSADEASWLAAGVRTLEHTIAALRIVEGRVQAYQRAINACRLTISALTDMSNQLDRRLKAVGDQLGADRHNVATAQALLNDEIDRVNGINQRRSRILAEHVQFIAFQRPRTVNVSTRGPLAPPGAPALSIVAAGALTGAYTYKLTFVTPIGETKGGPTSTTITAAAQQITLSGIPVGGPNSGVTARRIYRTTAGGADGTQRLLATIADNTTTTFIDNIADSALGAQVPQANSAVLTSSPTVPVRGLDPAFVDTAVPECLAQDESVPTEIQAMVDLLRDAPLSWILRLPPLLQNIDRLEVLRGTLLQGAKQRATARLNAVSFALPTPTTGSRLAAGISSAYTAQQQILSTYRMNTAQLDLAAFSTLSWEAARDHAIDIVSVGDLVDVSHGRSEVSQAVTNELNKIARVATCLYAKLHTVAPATRLVWAERLSQYDGPIDLTSLAQLPGWGSLDYVAREDMQTLADWLYQQVDHARPDAISIMHDLVRVCVLLASHAPVDEIIAGHVPHPTPIKPGGRIHLNVDESRVRIGMHVLLYSPTASDPVAHGVVEDLADGTAAARVLKSATTTFTLDESARVRFLQPSSFSASLVHGVLS